MPATHLRCRNCGTDTALDPVGTCARCWGPLDPVYDLDEIRPLLTRERIAEGPPVHLALRRAPARQRSRGASPRPRSDAPRRRVPARRGARRAGAPAEARHREPHALVQGPRRRRRGREGPGGGPGHARLLVDRESRRCRGGASGGGRHGRRGLLPARARAREALPRRRLRRDALRGTGKLRRLQPADGRAVVRAALGRSSTSACARTTQRARRPLRSRSRSSSAGRRPTSSCARWRPARCSRRWRRGSRNSVSSG